MEEVESQVESSLGIRTAPWVVPFALTLFVFILISNLIAIIPLGGVAFKLLGNYAAQRHEGKEPIFHRSDLPELRNVECWDGEEAMTRREFWEEQRA